MYKLLVILIIFSIANSQATTNSTIIDGTALLNATLKSELAFLNLTDTDFDIVFSETLKMGDTNSIEATLCLANPNPKSATICNGLMKSTTINCCRVSNSNGEVNRCVPLTSPLKTIISRYKIYNMECSAEFIPLMSLVILLLTLLF